MVCNMNKKIISTIFIIFFSTSAFAQGYHSQGRNAYVFRNYEKARDLFLKDIEATDRGDSYYFLGEIEKIEANYDKATEYFELAVTRKMTKKFMVNAYWNLIIFAENRQDFASMVTHCKELWAKTGDSSAKDKINSLINRLLWTNNEEAIAKYNKGMEFLKAKNDAEAEKSFREAISIDRNFLAPRFEMGMRAYRNRNDSDALYYLNEIAVKIPFYHEIQLITGDIHFKNRNYRTAAVNFTNAIDYGFISKNELNKTLIKRGTCYFHLSELDKAEEDMKTAAANINIRTNLEPVLVLSAIYIKKNDYDNALKTLARAESVSKDNPFILFQTGSIHYKNNDWKYVSYFDRLFDLSDKNDSDTMTSYMRAFTILMNAHYEKKNYSRSLQIAKAINSIKKDYQALAISARSDYFLGNNDSAIDTFENISLNNEDKLLLSSAYAKRGDKEKAASILRGLLYDSSLRERALKDRHLKPIVESIEAQRTPVKVEPDPETVDTNQSEKKPE